MKLRNLLFTAMICILALIEAVGVNGGEYPSFLEDKINKITSQVNASSKYKLNANGNCVSLEKEVIELMNEEREERKEPLKPLKLRVVLKKTARARSKEMFVHDYFEHARPNGDSWDTIFEEKAFKVKNRHKWAENIQFGCTQDMPTSTQVFEAFKNSKQHYKNMIGDYHYVGVGFYCQKIDGYYVWFVTQHFLTYMPTKKTK